MGRGTSITNTGQVTASKSIFKETLIAIKEENVISDDETNLTLEETCSSILQVLENVSDKNNKQNGAELCQAQETLC